MWRLVFLSAVTRSLTVTALILLGGTSATPLLGQTSTPTPTGTSVLTQALSASGAASAANPVKSFTAGGTITFFWAGKQVQGPATIRAQGSNQFRLDATLPGGTQSIAVNGNSGASKARNGKLTPAALHNLISAGGSSFPYLAIAAALSNPAFKVSYIASVASGSQQLQQVRITKNLPAAQDPSGIVAKLSQTDYFVDSQTNLIVKTADQTHPNETLTKDFIREMELQNYSIFNGVAVPTLVREKIAGQTIFELRLSSITFNTVLRTQTLRCNNFLTTETPRHRENN